LFAFIISKANEKYLLGGKNPENEISLSLFSCAPFNLYIGSAALIFFEQLQVFRLFVASLFGARPGNFDTAKVNILILECPSSIMKATSISSLPAQSH